MSEEGLGDTGGGGIQQPLTPLLPAAPAIHGAEEEQVEEVTATTNSTVRFECAASGHPVPAVSWLRDHVPIVASPRHQLLEGGTVLQVGVPVLRGWLCQGDRALFGPRGGGWLRTEPQWCQAGGPQWGCAPLAGGRGRGG